MSRNWQMVSKVIQKLAAGLYPIKSEGMFPYETHYVLATDEEVERLYSWGTATENTWAANGITKLKTRSVSLFCARS
jgi:hypothetical protein